MVRLNDDKDVKLTVAGNEFQTFMIRSTKTPVAHYKSTVVYIYSLYLCPRVVETVLSVKKSLRLTDTRSCVLYSFQPHSQRRTKPAMWHKWPLCGILSDPTLNRSGDGHNTNWLDYIKEDCSNPGITVYEAAQLSAY